MIDNVAEQRRPEERAVATSTFQAGASPVAISAIGFPAIMAKPDSGQTLGWVELTSTFDHTNDGLRGHPRKRS